MTFTNSDFENSLEFQRDLAKMLTESVESLQSQLKESEERLAETETALKKSQELARVYESALEFYRRHADCRSSVGFGVCRCAFCKGEPAIRQALAAKTKKEE